MPWSPASSLTRKEYDFIVTASADYEINNYDDLLNHLVSDIFTGILGWKNGTVPLRHDLGIDRIGDLIACTPAQILQAPGIGQRKLHKLAEGLGLLGLSLGEPSPTWVPKPIPFTTKFATRGLQ